MSPSHDDTYEHVRTEFGSKSYNIDLGELERPFLEIRSSGKPKVKNITYFEFAMVWNFCWIQPMSPLHGNLCKFKQVQIWSMRYNLGELKRCFSEICVSGQKKQVKLTSVSINLCVRTTKNGRYISPWVRDCSIVLLDATSVTFVLKAPKIRTWRFWSIRYNTERLEHHFSEKCGFR